MRRRDSLGVQALATGLWLLPIAAGALLWRLLFAGRVLVWGTALLQFYPWESLAVRLVRAGHWPWWNAFLGNGAPLLANLQSALAYPPNWVYLAVPVEHGMGWLAALHVVWGGLGLYALARALGLPRFAALVGALAFELNGYVIGRLSFLSMVYAVAWLPWLFVGAERLLVRRRLVDAALLAGVIAMQLLAGHAQISAYSLVGVALYVVWRTLVGRRLEADGDGPAPNPRLPVSARLGGLGLFALAVVLGLALAAVQLIPTAELFLQSSRAGGVERTFGLQYSLWPWRLLTLFAPYLFGSPADGTYWGYGYFHEDHNYVGLLPMVLAIGAGMAAVRQLAARDKQAQDLDRRAPAGTSQVIFFALLAALALFLALGQNNPAALWLWDHVPGFSLFQAPTRWSVLFVLAACVLAAYGAARWQTYGPGPEGARGLRYWSRLSIAGGTAFTILLLALRSRLDEPWSTFAVGLAVPGALVVATAVLVLVQPEPGRGRRELLWQGCVLILLALDLIAAGYSLNPLTEPRVYSGKTGAATALAAAGLDAARTFMPPDFEADQKDLRLSARGPSPEGVEYWWALREAGLPNVGVLDGLHSANNFDPLSPAGYRSLLEAAGTDPVRRLRIARLMGAGTILWRGDALAVRLAQRAGWGEVVYASGGSAYYRVPRPLPRAYAVPSVRVIAALPAQLDALLAPDFDPASEAVLEAAPAGLDVRGGKPAEFESTVAVLQDDGDAITIAARLSAPGLLVLTDTYYPGWQVTVDGRPAEMLRANVAVRGVVLPAGASTVRMAYRPLSVLLGGAVSLIGLGVCVAIGVIARRGPGGHFRTRGTR